MTTETSNTSSSLSDDDLARFASLRELLWKDHDDMDKCQPREARLSLEEWGWATSLIKEELVSADIASGLMTPVRFCLVLETDDKPELLMIGPMHVPAELGTTTEEIKKLFRELRDC